MICIITLWQDEDAFFTDYAAAHKKLSELGFTPAFKAAKFTLRAQSAVGVAIVAAMVILSYYYEVHKRLK